jgi:hypothetical protein
VQLACELVPCGAAALLICVAQHEKLVVVSGEPSVEPLDLFGVQLKLAANRIIP